MVNQIMKMVEKIAKNRLANLILGIGGISWFFDIPAFLAGLHANLAVVEPIAKWTVIIIGAVKVTDLVINWKKRK